MFILKPVLPLHGAFALRSDGGVKRRIRAGHPLVHADYFGLGHAQVGRDFLDHVRAHIAIFKSADLGLGLAQIEEQLFLCTRRAQFHQRPAAQDVFLNAGANPPHGIGRKAKAALGIKAFDRLHQAHVRLGNHLGLRQAVAAIAHGDLGRETQVAGHHPMRRLGVLFLDPTLGQHVFFFRFQ